ncbi:DNA polymerase III subunit beta [Petrotoga sp. 9PWA.NaAc.5.4]|uniref:DNA polymerase III subunit beta n=1 Tax=Petrotoga sp. 9PWA.NaAc.5.4 TaxID=1434328 RepID=UPI000CC5346C|nr:DNA polymerase III subunit beta [Petrotoga sp. 9PWA.NaAc.5.4]PNR96819.1 hypothetical protein X924_01955 [Petrotoga sp. 9PWA.NaAc.5.4]
MEIEVDIKALKNAVELTNNAVSKKTTNPILSGVKLETKENFLHIYATDLQTGFHKWLKVENTDGAFGCVVEQRIFLEILSNLSAEKAKLSLDSVLKISADNSNFKLPIMDPEEYPSLVFDVLGNSIVIERNIISNMIDKVIFCAQKDSSSLSRNLNAVYWDFRKGGFLNLVASDGYRLALSEKQLENESVLSSFLLSLKSMDELRSILSSAKSEKIKIIQSGSQVLFEFEDDEIEVLFNVVEAEYPDYLKIIPGSFITKIKTKTSDFLNIMKRLSIAAGKDEYALLNIEEGHIIFYASSPDVGEAREEIDVEQEGKNIEIAYSPRYFREALERIETVEFEFNISGEETPTILKPFQDDSYMFIIMPKRKA